MKPPNQHPDLYTLILLFFTLLIMTTTAHMQLSNPPPLRSEYNKYTTDVDYDMNSPLLSSGANYPCKGYLSLLGTPQATPVTTYTPGQSYSMTISGGASHLGGSCQASLSLDGGKTFRVIHSWVGNCPGLTPDSNFAFTVPGDVPGSKGAIFAWTWFNYSGNREMYMNCAVVDVVAGTGAGGTGGGTMGFESRPEVFKANIGNGCATVAEANTKFPAPGPEVDVAVKEAVPPVGNCGAVASPGVGSGSGSGGDGAGGNGSTGGGSSGGGKGSGGKCGGKGSGGSSGSGGDVGPESTGTGTGTSDGSGPAPAGGDWVPGQHGPAPATGTWTPGNTFPTRSHTSFAKSLFVSGHGWTFAGLVFIVAWGAI